MFGVLKRAVKAIAPATYARAAETYHYRRRFSSAERRGHRQTTARFERLVERLAAEGGWRVQSGPFAGLQYPSRSARLQWVGHILGSALAPKILGSYEAELHGAIASIRHERYSTIVDVGTGEGYYAVGLARMFPGAIVQGFETNRAARRFCLELAAQNGVAGRVRVGGAAGRRALGSALGSGRCLVLCDCEGCEEQLIDPEQVPGLLRADLLVELHETVAPGITALLRARFAPTHTVEILAETPREPEAYPALAALDAADRALALDEGRPAAMAWAWLRLR